MLSIDLSSDEAKYIKDTYATYARLGNSKRSDSTSDDRHQFQKDYSRILYSSSYRRLQGKMQLMGIASNRFFRNRLTHSHEVVQIARTISDGIREKLKEIFKDKYKRYFSETYVVEAASLAHDIGNPPFGHHGERVLNKLMVSHGGFEGNAQTFRVLKTLERRYPDSSGLQLSERTLLAVVKYFNKNKTTKQKHSKFLYADDYDYVETIKSKADVRLRTLDAQIMDVSDEIAYAAHDLEDSLRLGLFSIDDVLYEFEKSEEFSPALEVLKSIVENSRAFARKSTSLSSEDYLFFFTKELTSKIVDTLVKDIGLVEISSEEKLKTGSENNKEIGYKTLSKLSDGLKKITFGCVSRRPDITLYEMQGEKIIRDLWAMYIDKKFNSQNKLLPFEYRDLIKNGESRERVICDYISGMMDTYAIDIYKKHFGQNSLDYYYKLKQ